MSSEPRTLEEWVLALPEEDRKRLSAILLLTPFAKGYLEMAWDAGAQEGVRRAYASMPQDEGEPIDWTSPEKYAADLRSGGDGAP